MANGQRNDPYRSFNFRVDIDGLESAAFSEVSGLTAEGDSVDYREGTDATNTVRKLIGLRKFGTLTLKRGYTTN
jgi:phage tail-like protein